MTNVTSPVKGSASPVRIVVVDDSHIWRQYICSVLDREPELQVVAEAATGWEAVQKAQKLNADLILLDVSLPELNGIDAASRIREVAPRTKILFLTQNNDTEIIRAALNNGGQGYILKADGRSELLSGIKTTLRDQRFLSSGIKLQIPAILM